MRFFDAMTPAKSAEESALVRAKMPTLAKGAALKSVCRKEKLPAAVEIKENPAVRAYEEPGASHALRRAAFRHFLKKRF